MTVSTFILKNALRNKRRALLSVLSVAVSLFLFVTLLVALRELTVPVEAVGAATRIAVRNKISLANLLPARQKAVIERIEGIEAITPFTWFGGRYKDETGLGFGQFAIDPAPIPILFPDMRVPADQLEAFRSDRGTCLLGRVTAEKYGLRVGDRVPLSGTIFPVDLDLRIAGIYEGTPDDRNLFFHHAYLEEAAGLEGMVGMWWVKAASPELMNPIIDRINRAFENTAAEVRAETERAFQLGFLSMLGDVKFFVTSICSVVVFTLILVSASTMSMAVRERLRELSVLKALGFRRRELFGFILAESFGLAMLGALLGVGGAWVLFTQMDVAKLTSGVFIVLEVTPRIMGRAFLVAASLGVLASLAPAWSVARLSVVEGLKTLD